MRGGTLATTARKAAVDAALTTGLLRLLHRLTRQAGVSLLYHSVADGPGNPYLSEAAFRSQLEMLRAEFRVASGDEFMWHLTRSRPLPAGSVLITFDDGYRNNFTVVHPIMESLRLPWLLFAATQGLDPPGSALWMTLVRAVCHFSPETPIAFAGRDWSLSRGRIRTYKEIARWSSTQPSDLIEDAASALFEEQGHLVPRQYFASFCALMDADDLQQLGRTDLVEVGAHTRSHPFLPQVSSDRLHVEIAEAKHRLEEVLNRQVRMFAYPSGRYGTRELAKVADAGFDCAFTVVPQVGTTYRFEVPRVGVYSEEVGMLRAKCLGAASMLRAVGFHVG